MALFVLVHGGGHGGWCYQALARRLRAQGHEVYTPTLTGLGERAHLLTAKVTLSTHIEDVASLLFHEDLEDVILVGHSYGGMVITGVADRQIERVRRLVYLDATIPLDGESVVDGSQGLARFADVRVVEGVGLGLWPENVVETIYGLTDPELAAWAMPRLKPHPWATLEERLHLADPQAVKALPRAIINCTSTLERRRPEELARWRDGEYVREIDTGHDLMLTETDAVAAMLCEIAELP